MEKIDKWMTKKNMAIVWIAAMLIAYFFEHLFGIWVFLGSYSDAYRAIYKSIVWFSFPLTFVIFILYFLRDEIFRSWSRFAKWWILFHFSIMGFLIYIERVPSGGFGGFDIPIIEPISILLSGLFLVISIILVIIKYITLRKKA